MRSQFDTVDGGKDKGPPATSAQIAAFEFKSIRQFQGMTKEKRLKLAHENADILRAMAVVAIEIVALDKSELIAKVRENYDKFGPFLMELAHARDHAQAFMEFIGSAETRLAVALAVVEGDEAD